MKKTVVFLLLCLPLYTFGMDHEGELTKSKVKELFESKIEWTDYGPECSMRTATVRGLPELTTFYYQKTMKKEFDDFFDNHYEENLALLIQVGKAIREGKTRKLRYKANHAPVSVQCIVDEYDKSKNSECVIL